MNKLLTISLVAILSISCDRSIGTDKIAEDQNMSMAMAVLYNYYAAEYSALAHQAYNIASHRLIEISENYESVSSLAIVVDIDETVLDNSPFQAKAIINNSAYPQGWDEWCNESIANPVPGALEFLNLADSMGYKIFYISNRKNDFVYEGTMNNLVSQLFPQLDSVSLMLREETSIDNPDPSDKERRREQIRNMGYKIVLLVGDNLGDFYSDNPVATDRKEKIESIKKDLGNKFIVLPNAMYGNWPASIGLDGTEESLHILLKEMSDIY